jgi:hypothetical protein
VLLLGCGDVRNALTNAAALRSAGASSSSSSGSSYEVHLNDISDAILARDALLLAAATTMDPSSAADVEFLWALWFCAQLTAENRQRLNLLLQQVRVGEGQHASCTHVHPAAASAICRDRSTLACMVVASSTYHLKYFCVDRTSCCIR